MQEHGWSGPRLHQPQGHSAAASPTAGALHRSAHGVRGKVGQTVVLNTHCGSQAQGIWRPLHHRPHGRSIACSFPLTQGAGAKVENEHDAAYFWGCQTRADHFGNGVISTHNIQALEM